MAEIKVITVFGATGAQGGGLVRAIMDDMEGGFLARAVTRDPNSDKAKALADLGAEVVAGDVDDADSIVSALDGAYGAFFITFFWDHFSPEKELAQAAVMASAAKANNIQHAIWSTLEDVREFVPLDSDQIPTLQGKYKVPHFDAKGEANGLFTQAGVPTTFLNTSFYWENFIYFGLGPKTGADGKTVLNLPMGDKPLPGIAAEDIGRCAYGVFKRPDLIGQSIGIEGGEPTGAEMAATLGEVLGKEITYNAVPFEVFRGLGFPGADDLGNMFQFKHDFNDQFAGARDINLSKSLNPQLQTFRDWAKVNASKIPLT